MTFPDSIGIVGSIAVGKTSLGQAFAQLRSDITFLPDLAPENPFIANFYQDRKRWSFHSRIAFLAQRTEIYRRDTPSALAVIDRPVHELIVFATAHHQSGYLSDDEFSVYQSLYKTLIALCPMPRLFIRVTCATDEALRRITKRQRTFEMGIDETYLKQIENEYDSWLNTLPPETVIIVRTDHENPEQIAQGLLPKIISQVRNV